MRISVSHVSEYTYEGPQTSTVQALRLTPAPVKCQTVLSWTIDAPGFGTACSYLDGFGNHVDLVSAPADLAVVRVAAFGEVETTDTGGVAGWTDEAVAPGAFLRVSPITALSDEIEAIAASVRQANRLATLHTLMDALHERLEYDPGSSNAKTSAAAAFAAGRGVCQDHAHVFITAARSLGIPARYVTGYLVLHEQTGAPAHHAWAEALVEDIGWVGFDTTNAQCPTDRYVRLGSGLDAASAAPIRGFRRLAGQERLSVAVTVHASTQTQQ